VKNMAVVSQSSGNPKFKVYGVVATVCPLVLLIVTVILDFSLSKRWDFWPGIGLAKCWFRSEY